MAAPIVKGSNSDRLVLETLSLPELPSCADELNCQKETTLQAAGHTGSCLPCLFCLQTFSYVGGKDECLKHLLEIHKLVIADVNLIADLRGYLLYWKERFKEQPLVEFCSEIKTSAGNHSEEGQGKYHLLSDVLPEDKQLREFLQKRKLEKVLECQQRERESVDFSRGCLFCRAHFTGNRSLLFNHLAQGHSFSVGLPDNLVYTDELLDKLEEKLKNLQCLYCEKTFKDREVLKEHMRKKQHKKINPKNRSYDRFYIINYLELGKNWEKIRLELDRVEDFNSDDTDTEDEWSGWEEEAGSQAVCLYCEFSSSHPDKLNCHMQELHDVDLAEIKLRLNLNFYQQVKLINYIRRQVHLGVCIGCQQKFDSKQSLTDHMHTENHTNKIPDTSVWDQPEYYFPTYENDNLLCQLEYEGDDDLTDDPGGCHGNTVVIAEDEPVIDTILTEENLRKEILQS